MSKNNKIKTKLVRVYLKALYKVGVTIYSFDSIEEYYKALNLIDINYYIVLQSKKIALLRYLVFVEGLTEGKAKREVSNLDKQLTKQERVK